MKSETFKEAVAYTVSLLYVLLFVYAALNKILEFEHFRIELGQSPLLSAFADPVSVAVPVTELLISMLLLIPRFRLIGLLLSFSLMVMFTAYIVIILNWSSFIPCSCGGILSELGWTEHLIFNVVFIVMAVAGLIAQAETMLLKNSFPVHRKYFTAAVSACFCLSVILVVSLYLLSEHEVHRNNGFLRRYPQHPVTKIIGKNIKFNSYYIAGYANGNIYLGNTSAPLHMLVADTTLTALRPVTIEVDENDEAAVSALQVRIQNPYFYITDGTVPLIYRGRLDSLIAKPFLKKIPNFSQVELMRPGQFVIRSLDTKQNTTVIGRVTTAQPKALLAPALLQKQSDGIFDTDGMLLYSSELNQIVYVYYYRNEFIAANADMTLHYRGRTIDTVARAVIKLAYEDSARVRTMAKRPPTINMQSCTAGRYLFIQSDRLGRYEPEVMLEDAAIVDVYDLVKQTYEFSFYLYDHEGERMKSFQVYGNLLVGLSEHYVVLYRLQREFFDLNH